MFVSEWKGPMNEAIKYPSATSICRHRWIIEPANGPVSRGRCVKCHSSRDFFNSPELAQRDRGESEAQP
jgi:hypothetical protein